MYTTTVKVPFISAETISRFFADLPASARSFVDIPLVDTADAASASAREVTNESLTGYEFVREVVSVTLDDTQSEWAVKMIISGD